MCNDYGTFRSSAVCRVPSYHAAVGYTHSLGWEPRKDPTCVKPIVTDTSDNQSSTQVHQY